MRQRWEAAVSQAFPDGSAKGFPAYPLLGGELPEAEVRAVAPWRLRLSLRREFPASQMQALLEDVQELRWQGELALGDLPDSLEIYSDTVDLSAAWRFEREEQLEGEPFPVRRRVWRAGDKVRTEFEVVPDSQVLRNLAWLGARPAQQRWVVSSSRSAGGEAEELIADTLVYWTAAVAGVGVLEVAEQPGDDFESLWNRLCLVRLLRHEAELGDPGDALSGAGFFSSVRE